MTADLAFVCYREKLAEKLGAEHWDGELLAMWALERINELEGDNAKLRASIEKIEDAAFERGQASGASPFDGSWPSTDQ